MNIFVMLQIGVNVDTPSDHISCSTALATSPASPAPRRLLDTIASRALEVAVVALWHGVSRYI